MATFTYTATDRTGKTVAGKMEAHDAGAVAERLQQLQFYPLGIHQAAGEKEHPGLAQRTGFMRRGEALAHFTRQLAVLLGAGLPLDRSLAIANELVEEAQFSAVVARIHRAVQEGSSLASALSRHPRHFSELYVSMVAAGEASGALEGILSQLADFLEEWQRIRAVIVTALTYPLFLVAFAILAVISIMAFVVPKFATVFEGVESRLPAPTRALIWYSASLQRFWWVWALLLGAAAAAAVMFLRSRSGREWTDRRILSLPFFGDLAVKIQVSRFARILGTLASGGVPILKALEIVTPTLTNSVFSRSLARVQSGLKEGQGIAKPLQRAGVFPPLFLHMVTVGEETGKLEEMLLTTARTYDREIEAGTRRLLSLLEPIIILTVGIVIGTIILSILWGIFSVNNVVF